MLDRPTSLQIGVAIASTAARRRRAVLACLLLVLASAFVAVPKARAATVTAVLQCNPCTSVDDMLAAANSAYTTLWSGDLALMVSLNEPVSAYLKLACSPAGKGGGCEWSAVTESNADAAALDNSIFARAAKLQPITTPSTITYSDEDSVITAYIQSQLQATGQTGFNPWHLLPGFPSAIYFTMIDLQTGQTENIYVGDEITVQYPDGYSEKWQFLGVTAGSIQWKRVANTLMKNGQPVNPPSSTAGSPQPGYGAASGADAYNPGRVSVVSQDYFCSGVSSVSITDADGNVLSTSYGIYIFPC
jgi:hypothetical protein